MGCGHDSTRQARAVVADCAHRVQSRQMSMIFNDGLPWAVFVKVHDATKLEATIPDDMMMKIDGILCTARGSLIVNSFVQEDRLYAEGVSEVGFYFPCLLEAETGDTVFHACTSGSRGVMLEALLSALRTGKLQMALLLDHYLYLFYYIFYYHD